MLTSDEVARLREAIIATIAAPVIGSIVETILASLSEKHTSTLPDNEEDETSEEYSQLSLWLAGEVPILQSGQPYQYMSPGNGIYLGRNVTLQPHGL